MFGQGAVGYGQIKLRPLLVPIIYKIHTKRSQVRDEKLVYSYPVFVEDTATRVVRLHYGSVKVLIYSKRIDREINSGSLAKLKKCFYSYTVAGAN